LPRPPENVRGKAGDFLNKTAQALNPSAQIKEHPWLSFGGALLLGYELGRREARQWPVVNSDSFRISKAAETVADHPVADPRRHSMNTIWDEFAAQIQDEIESLKTALFKTTQNFIHTS
jgi:hypothetical protein